jgi:hypothetical protein
MCIGELWKQEEIKEIEKRLSNKLRKIKIYIDMDKVWVNVTHIRSK